MILYTRLSHFSACNIEKLGVAWEWATYYPVLYTCTHDHARGVTTCTQPSAKASPSCMHMATIMLHTVLVGVALHPQATPTFSMLGTRLGWGALYEIRQQNSRCATTTITYMAIPLSRSFYSCMLLGIMDERKNDSTPAVGYILTAYQCAAKNGLYRVYVPTL